MESKDPDGIDGVTEEFMVHLVRAVKDAQVEEKHCYHCSSLEHFIHNCPLVRASRQNMQLNCKKGMASKKGAQAPQTIWQWPRTPRRRIPRCKTTHADSLLGSRPLSALVQGQKHGQSEDQRGELHGSAGQWCTNQYHHASLCEESLI